MRRLGQQHFALGQRFANQAQLVVFEIAQPAVHQLAAGGGGVFAQVALFAEKHRQAAPDGIGGDTCAIDAAANHGQVVDFRERCKKRMIHGRL